MVCCSKLVSWTALPPQKQPQSSHTATSKWWKELSPHTKWRQSSRDPPRQAYFVAWCRKDVFKHRRRLVLKIQAGWKRSQQLKPIQESRKELRSALQSSTFHRRLFSPWRSLVAQAPPSRYTRTGYPLVTCPSWIRATLKRAVWVRTIQCTWIVGMRLLERRDPLWVGWPRTLCCVVDLWRVLRSMPPPQTSWCRHLPTSALCSRWRHRRTYQSTRGWCFINTRRDLLCLQGTYVRTLLPWPQHCLRWKCSGVSKCARKHDLSAQPQSSHQCSSRAVCYQRLIPCWDQLISK